MDVSFVPSLERSCCEKIIMLLLDDNDLLWRGQDQFEAVTSKVVAKISKLLPCEPVQRNVREIITPVLMGVTRWMTDIEDHWKGISGSHSVFNTIQICRLRDGTIDKEKCVSMLVKNKDINPLNRLMTACIFCMFEDVPDLWNSLDRIEKAFLRNESSKNSDVTCAIYGHWIEWLESNRERDWESFAAWTWETPVWKSNVHIMKRVLRTVNPSVYEKSQYLLKALTEKSVSSDVMWFGLSMLSADEREVVYRESILQVFKCILSWPVRHVFHDFANKLWPYVTEDTFFNILEMMFEMVRNEQFSDMLRTEQYLIWNDHIGVLELIVILKTFWAQSPGHYKKFVENDESRFRRVKYVLELDHSKPFRIPTDYFFSDGVYNNAAAAILFRNYFTFADDVDNP